MTPTAAPTLGRAAAPPARTAAWVPFAPLFAVLVWTGNVLVTRRASAVIEPAAITFFRWAIAFAVLTPFLGRAVWRQRAVVRAHWPRLGLLGVLGMSTYQGLAYEAARTASAIDMGVMTATMPLLSALLARAFAAEAPSRAQAGGAIVSLLGIAWLVTRGHPAALAAGGVHVGEGLMLLAVSSNALYGVLLRRWAIPLTSWQQVYVQVGFGTLAVLPFWIAGGTQPVTAASAPLVAYAALPASIAAPFFWVTGVKHHGAPRASLFLNLLPLLVALAAWALLGEPLQAFHAVGGLLVLAGVAWGLRG
jgi:drug/metabolite transporter (DMT)-like permease